MLPLCWVPLLLVGYAQTIETTWHHTKNISGPYVELQTCKTGLGVHGKVGTEPWVSGGVHYGFTWDPMEKVQLTLQPQVGLSYSNTINPVNHVRQITKFEVGLGGMLSYHKYHAGVEYIHMSNGSGWNPGNIGVDQVGFQVGYSF